MFLKTLLPFGMAFVPLLVKGARVRRADPDFSAIDRALEASPPPLAHRRDWVKAWALPVEVLVSAGLWVALLWLVRYGFAGFSK